MNVKISYTIPFEQIPEHLQKVLRDSADKAAVIDNVLRYIYIDHNSVDDSLLEIDEIRKKMASLDLLLRDCYSILTGYQKAIEGAFEEPSQNEESNE